MPETLNTLELPAMTAASNSSGGQRRSAAAPWRWWTLLFVVALAFRVFLLFDFPGMYGWDAYTRIWESGTLFVRFWLPLPQLPVLGVASIGGDIVLLRCIYLFFGAAASVSVGLAAARYWGRPTGLCTGWLVCFSPTFAMYSTFPYQEAAFVMFLGLALWKWPVANDGASGRSSLWIASVSLALAGLCRYEAWVIGAVLFVALSVRRQYRDLVCILPLGAVALAWTLTGPWRPEALGAMDRVDSFKSDLLSATPGTWFRLAWEFSGEALFRSLFDWMWIGGPLILWGIIDALRRGGVPGREWALIGLVLFAMTIARSINSDILMDRMLVLPVVWALPYFASAAAALADRLARRVRPALRVATSAVVVMFFVLRAHLHSEWSSGYFQPEFEAAGMLCALPQDVSVEIVPRAIPNRWGELSISAIFGHSMRLDPHDPRWSYEAKQGKNRAQRPDRVLVWNGSKYVFQK